MAYVIVCPDCRKKFKFDPNRQQYPESCPMCGEFLGAPRANDDIAAPSIRRAATSVADKVYRDAERAGDYRAQQAAQELGVPVSEMSALKVTDMREAPREGDVAAPPVTAANNEIVRFAEQHGVGPNFAPNEGSAYAGAVAQGPYPNAGIRQLQTVKRLMS